MMLSRPHCLSIVLLLAGLWGMSTPVAAEEPVYYWTMLQPENDTRDADEQSYDDFVSSRLVASMNENAAIFKHHLIWNKLSIRKLLTSSNPFCVLCFDAVHPFILTDKEKSILREYLARGGFLLLVEDCYPYPQDVLWQQKSWPIIDFLTKELPASSPDFRVEKINDMHPIFHQYYQTETADSIRHELRDNPYTPNRSLLTYRHNPSAFVIGSYYLTMNDVWIPNAKPYPHIYGLHTRSYELNVNIYVYATMH